MPYQCFQQYYEATISPFEDIAQFEVGIQSRDLELAEKVLRRWKETREDRRYNMGVLANGFDQAVSRDDVALALCMFGYDLRFDLVCFDKATKKQAYGIPKLFLQHGYDKQRGD